MDVGDEAGSMPTDNNHQHCCEGMAGSGNQRIEVIHKCGAFGSDGLPYAVDDRVVCDIPKKQACRASHSGAVSKHQSSSELAGNVCLHRSAGSEAEKGEQHSGRHAPSFADSHEPSNAGPLEGLVLIRQEASRPVREGRAIDGSADCGTGSGSVEQNIGPHLPESESGLRL